MVTDSKMDKILGIWSAQVIDNGVSFEMTEGSRVIRCLSPKQAFQIFVATQKYNSIYTCAQSFLNLLNF